MSLNRAAALFKAGRSMIGCFKAGSYMIGCFKAGSYMVGCFMVGCFMVGGFMVGCSSATPSTLGAEPATAPPPAALAAPTPSPAPSVEAPSVEAPTVEAPTVAAPTVAASPAPITFVTVEVIESYPHDPTAYTQGLELFDGWLIESTGLEGRSSVRRVELETGRVDALTPLATDRFGEGLTRVGDNFVQLTWLDNRVHWFDVETLEPVRETGFDFEGWGLCLDGDRLVHTDGSATARLLDPETLEVLTTTTITVGDTELERVNELECVDGAVWGNVYLTDTIVRFDPDTGVVDRVVDASSLGQPRLEPAEVLNGIAYDERTDTWLLTGKFWPEVHRVRFVVR